MHRARTRPRLGALLLTALVVLSSGLAAAPSPLTLVRYQGEFFAGVPTRKGLFRPWKKVLFLGMEELGPVQYFHFGSDEIELYQRFLVANPEELPHHPGYRFRVDRARQGGKPLTREAVRAGLRSSKLPVLPAEALAVPDLARSEEEVVVYSPDLERPEQVRELPICQAPAREERANWKGLECFWVHEGLLLDSFRTRLIPREDDARAVGRLVEPELQANFLEKRSLWDGSPQPRHFLEIRVSRTPPTDAYDREALYRLQVGKRRFGALRRYLFGRYVVYSGGDPHQGFDPIAVAVSSLSTAEKQKMGLVR